MSRQSKRIGSISFVAIQAMFNSEIFFNIILPPIIFHAGYSMKRVRTRTSTTLPLLSFRLEKLFPQPRRHSDVRARRNSARVLIHRVGPVAFVAEIDDDRVRCARIIVYGSVRAFSSLRSYFSFTDSLYFGAIISATDPGELLSYPRSRSIVR